MKARAVFPFLLTLLLTLPTAKAQDTPVAGPHLSGDAYIALRGDEPHKVVAFEVETGSRTSSLVRAVEIGPDYAVETSGETRLLYDFRFRRLLTLNPGERSFLNQSLFGHARTRFSFLQNNLTTAGMGIAGGIIEGQLAGAIRFVTEHGNGMAHPAEVALFKLPRPVFALTRDDTALTGTLDGVPVLTATLTDTAFPTDDHARSFAAWLAWGGRMHPAIAKALAGSGQVPERIEFAFPEEMRTLSPSLAAQQELELRGIEIRAARFDRLRDWASKIPAWPPHLPEELAQIMVDAANGTAPGGPKTDAEFIEEMNRHMEFAKTLDAVLVGLHASHPYDGCSAEHRAQPLCASLGSVLNGARHNPHVRSLFAGFAVEREREYRRAAAIWVELRPRVTNRVDVLDFAIANALVEAHKKSPLKGEMATAFARLPELFTRALAVDPYDPARYRDIYNYLFAAATGLSDRYLVPTQAHAVIDLARALPDRPMPQIITQVSDADDRIAQDFPVLFPATVAR